MEQLRIFDPDNHDNVYPDENTPNNDPLDQTPPFDPDLAAKEKEKREQEQSVREEVASWEPSEGGKRKEEKPERKFGFNVYLDKPRKSDDDPDFASAIREGLKDRLRRGYSKREGNGRIQYTPESIFDTKEFKKYQKIIGINFADPEIFDLSFSGLITLLRVNNNESANWYYDNIFFHDPTRLTRYLDNYKKNEDCDDKMRTAIDDYKKRQQKKEIAKNNSAQLQIEW